MIREPRIQSRVVGDCKLVAMSSLERGWSIVQCDLLQPISSARHLRKVATELRRMQMDVRDLWVFEARLDDGACCLAGSQLRIHQPVVRIKGTYG